MELSHIFDGKYLNEVFRTTKYDESKQYLVNAVVQTIVPIEEVLEGSPLPEDAGKL